MKKSFSMWRAGLAAVSAMVWLVATAGAEPFVVGWGMNADGQAAPVPVEALSGATYIAAGAHHSLAVVDGCTYAWGANDTNFYQCVVPPAGRTNVVAVAAGDDFSVALRKDGTIVSWGRTDVTSEFSRDNTNGVAKIAAGEQHLLILKDDGRVMAVGANSYAPECQVPESLSGVDQLAAGAHFSLALKSDGSIVAWGDPDWDGGVLDIPASLTNGNVRAIAAGYYHALAITDTGGVVAWGANFDAADTNSYRLPPEVSSGVTNIAAGYDFSMALKTDGSVVAWGDGSYGQTNNLPPSLKAKSSQIAAGYGHCLVLGSGLAPYWLGDSVPGEAYVARPYSGYVSATGMPAVAYHQAGNWPSWLALDPKTGILSGTPAKTAAVSRISIIASNIYGTVTTPFEVHVSDTPIDPPVFITQRDDVDDGEVGVPYSFPFQASNSPVFYATETNNYPLPDGLELAPDGILKGIPTGEYDSIFYVVASNEAGAVTSDFHMTVTAASARPEFKTESPLDNATVGEDYDPPAYIETDRVATFRFAGGTLPDGIVFEPATGMACRVSGTPTASGRYEFSVEAANAVGTNTAEFVLEVWEAPSITTPTLPGGRKGESYPYTITATGYPAPGFTVIEGSLPAGLTLDPSGAFLGKLTATNTYYFTVKASSAAGEDTHPYTVTVDSGDYPSDYPRFTSMTFTNNKVRLVWTNGTSKTRLDRTADISAASPVWIPVATNAKSWTGTQTNGPVFYRLLNR